MACGSSSARKVVARTRINPVRIRVLIESVCIGEIEEGWSFIPVVERSKSNRICWLIGGGEENGGSGDFWHRLVPPGDLEESLFSERLETSSPVRQFVGVEEEIYLAGGCLWGVQEFLRHLPGVLDTEAGRANGTSCDRDGDYDGYAECVRTRFDSTRLSVKELMGYFFEIIDPYSRNRQGNDVGPKYRTGVYSLNTIHLEQARAYLWMRGDRDQIVVEVLPLSNYVRSAEEHQDRLTRNPEDPCHIPRDLLLKYKKSSL